MTPSSHRIDAGLWASCAAAFAFAAALVAPAVLTGSDLYWHIVAGRWMIENQQVLRINLFSFAFAGEVWQNQDWLSELLLAGAYVGAGWSGVMALAAAAAAGSAGLLAFHLARGPREAINLIWLALALVIGASVLKALPYLLALPCCVAWSASLARADGKAPSLKLLPVMLVWANLSNTFVIGLALTVVLAAEAVLAAPGKRPDVARHWAVFTGFALVFALITPTGVVGLVHAVRAFAAVGPVETVLPLILALPAAALLAPHRRTWLRLLLIAALFVPALTSTAGRMVFAGMVPLLVAGPAADQSAPVKLRPFVALVLVMLVGAAVRIAIPLVRHDDGFSPGAAIDRVPLSLRHQPVLNEPAFGGFLIFREVKPFIDSRPLYSAATRARFAANSRPDLLRNTLTRYHIRWTILASGDPVVAAMDAMPGWHRLYTDQWAVVHVRGDGR